MDKANRPIFIFLTAFYTLVAYTAHTDSYWLWSKAIAMEKVHNWYIFGYDITHNDLFYAFWFLSWLISVFLCALFPFIQVLRIGTAVTTTYILLLTGIVRFNQFFVIDFINLLPLIALAILPLKTLAKFEYLLMPSLGVKKDLYRLVVILKMSLLIYLWYPRLTYKYSLIFLISLIVASYSEAYTSQRKDE